MYNLSHCLPHGRSYLLVPLPSESYLLTIIHTLVYMNLQRTITRITIDEALVTLFREALDSMQGGCVTLTYYSLQIFICFTFQCMYSSICLSFTSKILLSLTTFLPWHFLHLSLGLSTSPEKSNRT